MRMDFPALVLLVSTMLVLASCASPSLEPEEHDADFYNENAQRFYDGGHYDRAQRQFEKALEQNPSDFKARLGRAWCLLMLGEGRILLQRPEGAENIQMALEELEKLKDDASDAQLFKVQLGLGKAHARMADLYQNRAELIEAQSKLRPPGGPEEQALLTARTKADEHRRAAEAQFQAVLSTEENAAAQESIPALIELARLAVFDRRLEEARSYASRYLEQVRKSKELWAETIRRYPEDRPLWDAKLASAVVKEVEARDLLGNIYYKMGRLDDALEQLDHVLLLSPERGDAYLNRAIIYEDLDRKRDAVEDLKLFMIRAAEIEMDPGDSRAIEATKRLMRLERELGMEPTIPTTEPAREGSGA